MPCYNQPGSNWSLLTLHIWTKTRLFEASHRLSLFQQVALLSRFKVGCCWFQTGFSVSKQFFKSNMQDSSIKQSDFGGIHHFETSPNIYDTRIYVSNWFWRTCANLLTLQKTGFQWRQHYGNIFWKDLEDQGLLWPLMMQKPSIGQKLMVESCTQSKSIFSSIQDRPPSKNPRPKKSWEDFQVGGWTNPFEKY